MKNTKLFRAVLAALAGHTVGLLLLLLLAVFALSMDRPLALSKGFSLVALAAGAAFCGIISGKQAAGPFLGAVSGVIFSGILFAVSFLSQGNESPIALRLLILAAMVLISFVFCFFTGGKGIERRRKKSSAAKKRAIYRNI